MYGMYGLGLETEERKRGRKNTSYFVAAGYLVISIGWGGSWMWNRLSISFFLFFRGFGKVECLYRMLHIQLCQITLEVSIFFCFLFCYFSRHHFCFPFRFTRLLGCMCVGGNPGHKCLGKHILCSVSRELAGGY